MKENGKNRAAMTSKDTVPSLTLMRTLLSARFFLQWYRIFFFHTLFLRLSWKRLMMLCLSSLVYMPMRPFLLYTVL